MTQFVVELAAQLQQIALGTATDINGATSNLQKQFYPSPDCIPALLEIAATPSSSNNALAWQARQLAAVELRKRVAADWSTLLSEAAQHHVRQQLLLCCITEPIVAIRHSLANVVVAIAKEDVPLGQWDDLLLVLNQWCSDAHNVIARECGFFVVNEMFEDLADVAYDNLPRIFELLKQAIVDSESIAVRVLGVRAMAKLAEFIDPTDDGAVKQLQLQLSPMAAVINQLVHQNDSTNNSSNNSSVDVVKCVMALSDLLMLEMPIFKDCISDLLGLFLNLASNTAITIDDSVRNALLNFTTWSIECWGELISARGLVPSLVERLMTIVCQPGGISDKDGRDGDGDDDDDEIDAGSGDDAGIGSETPLNNALRALGALSTRMPRDAVFPLVLRNVVNVRENPHDTVRRGALLALAVVSSGHTDAFLHEIDTVAQLIAGGLSDQSPRVRSAACRSLGIISVEVGSELAVKHHSLLLPPLLHQLQITSTEHGQTKQASSLLVARACSALSHLLDVMDSASISQYAPSIFDGLCAVLQHAKVSSVVKTTAVTALGGAAKSCSEGVLSNYLAGIMHVMSTLITLPSETDSDLRGTALSATASIASSAGADAFRPWLAQAMSSASDGLQLGYDGLKPAAYMLYSSLASVYGEQFGEVIQSILPPLRSSLKERFADEDDATSLKKEIDLDSIDDSSFDTSAVGLNDDDYDDDDVEHEVSAEIESAIQLVGSLVEHVGIASRSLIPEFVESLLALTEFPSGSVRLAALTTLLDIITVVFRTVAHPATKWDDSLNLPRQATQDLRMVIGQIMPTVIRIWTEETNLNVVSDFMAAFENTLDTVGPALIANWVKPVNSQFLTIFRLKSSCQIALRDDYAGNESISELSSRELDMIYRAGEAFIAFLRVLGPDEFVPGSIKTSIGYILALLGAKDADFFYSTLAGIIEVSASAMSPFTETLLAAFSRGIQTSEPFSGAVANCVYGVGVLVEKTTMDVTKHLQLILNLLQPRLSRPAQNDHSSNIVTANTCVDNACASLCRVISKYSHSIPLATVLPSLLAALPLRNEFDETNVVVHCLSSLIVGSTTTPAIGSVVAQYLPKISELLVNILGHGHQQRLSQNTANDAVKALQLIDVSISNVTYI
ncbi:ARM repeat-containing protein [Ramicandelaber brevisporus]|nr:ARM repeat-containing protein [Ramicandelaber brevisporus]